MDETREEIGLDLQACAECLQDEGEDTTAIQTYFYFNGERFNVTITRWEDRFN